MIFVFTNYAFILLRQFSKNFLIEWWYLDLSIILILYLFGRWFYIWCWILSYLVVDDLQEEIIHRTNRMLPRQTQPLRLCFTNFWKFSEFFLFYFYFLNEVGWVHVNFNWGEKFHVVSNEPCFDIPTRKMILRHIW